MVDFSKNRLRFYCCGSSIRITLKWIISLYQSDSQERIKNIADYDRHGRLWNNKEETTDIEYYNKFRIPRGLFMLISWWKNTLEYKIQIMKDWILTGSFEKY